MNDFMLVLRVPNHSSIIKPHNIVNEAFIQLIDYENLMDAKRLESPQIIKKISKVLFPACSGKYVEGEVYHINEFTEKRQKMMDDNDLYPCILHNIYIMKDENEKNRIILNTDLDIHNLLTNRIIKIPVFDTKEDLSNIVDLKDIQSITNSFLYNKKIWGVIPYVKDMENRSDMSIKEIVESAINLNASDIHTSDLGFLIEYHDCKLSTVEFVDGFFNDMPGINHSSIIITGENKIYQVQYVERSGMICLIDLKDIFEESVILE